MNNFVLYIIHVQLYIHNQIYIQNVINGDLVYSLNFKNLLLVVVQPNEVSTVFPEALAVLIIHRTPFHSTSVPILA